MDTSSRTFLAEQYFCDCMSGESGHSGKVVLFEPRHDRMWSLHKDMYNPRGGHCYLLTVWVLLALQSTDLRLCGTIDTMEREGYRIEKDYEHAWVEFKTKWGEFVYDPLLSYITPREVYYDVCHPRQITSELTQKEMLRPYLSSKYAFKIYEGCWQFKTEKDVRLPEDYEKNGYVFNALQKGRVHGYFEDGSCIISAFIAHDPRYY